MADPSGLLADLTMLGASAIWGIGISQTFKFLLDIRQETRRLVFLVAWICLTDTIREIFSVYTSITIYLNTAAYFQGDSGQTPVSPIALVMAYMFSSLSAVTAQSFFLLRIWRLYNTILIPIIATPIILFQLCVPLVYFQAISLSSKTTIEAQKDLLIATLVIGAFIDVSLSAALCALLWKHYMADGPLLKTTKSMLQRMILFSVNTGMWTALVACMVIYVFFRTSITDVVVFGYFHILSPLYFATVLANLNARPYLRKQLDPSLPSNLVPLSLAGGQAGVAQEDGHGGRLIHLNLMTGSKDRDLRHDSSITLDPTLLFENSDTDERTPISSESH